MAVIWLYYMVKDYTQAWICLADTFIICGSIHWRVKNQSKVKTYKGILLHPPSIIMGPQCWSGSLRHCGSINLRVNSQAKGKLYKGLLCPTTVQVVHNANVVKRPHVEHEHFLGFGMWNGKKCDWCSTSGLGHRVDPCSKYLVVTQ
mgnify:FL=1